jgi:ribosomal protein L11 methyltransferase
MRSWPALEVGRQGSAAANLDAGASGPDDDLVLAVLVDHDVAAIEERAESLSVFFHTAPARNAAAAALRTAFPALRVVPLDIPDEDWAARSQASLKAVQVGDFIVAPPWDVPDAGTGVSRTIVIQPSMGFGTGHHATTRLCLLALQRLNLAHRRVLDVGTGSGVLAIASSLHGAPAVTAIDADADAVEAARENLLLNPGASVTLRLTDLHALGAERFDVLVANLTGGLLIQAARRLQDLATTLVLSGFLTHEEADVRSAYAALDADCRAEEDGWVCVTLSSR